MKLIVPQPSSQLIVLFLHLYAYAMHNMHFTCHILNLYFLVSVKLCSNDTRTEEEERVLRRNTNCRELHLKCINVNNDYIIRRGIWENA